MQFDERTEGDFRIYVGAIETPCGSGYIAAAAVVRAHGRPSREFWRDDNLACGHHWPSAQAALRYAMAKAREVVHNSRAAEARACPPAGARLTASAMSR